MTERIKRIKREVRRLMALGVGYPPPPEVILALAHLYRESPLCIDSIVMAEHEGTRRVQWEPWEREFLRQHYMEMSDAEMGKILGRSRDSVRDQRLSMGLFRGEAPRRRRRAEFTRCAIGVGR